ncbi:MAG TPA: tetratricopeptide repeat protein [Mariprofundaceae bacterium]|nr:tetratricopeptide repeat protein [Mariprofundaceae bacterium]
MTRLICAILVLLPLFAACSGKSANLVENPYLERARNLSADGMAAMQRERWSAAERAFLRALQAAQLSDDTALVRLSWYNLGVVRTAMDHVDSAAEAFRRSMELAERQGDPVMRVRAGLALSLMQVRHQKEVDPVSVPDIALPADVHLQRGRLAQLQGDTRQADKSYHLAIAKSVNTSGGLKISADAYMGLALLYHQAGDDVTAKIDLDKALSISRHVGAPRLIAHALLLGGSIADSPLQKKDQFERALAIYTAMEDLRGQRETLESLQQVAVVEDDQQALERIRLRLQNLSQKSVTTIPPAGDGL